MTIITETMSTCDTRIDDIIGACADALFELYVSVADKAELGDLNLVTEVCTREAAIGRQLSTRVDALIARPRFRLVRIGAWLSIGSRWYAEVQTVIWFIDLLDGMQHTPAKTLAQARKYAEAGWHDRVAGYRPLVLDSLWQRYGQCVTRRVR